MNCEGSGDDCFDPEKNPVLRREIKAARRIYVPDNYISASSSSPSRATPTSSSRSTTPTGTSEAYLTVSGQNSNNSVRVTDEFLKAVEADGDWDLTWRTKTGKVAKTVKARELWEKIALRRLGLAPIPACSTTPPSTTGTPARRRGRSAARNPCSEYMFLDDTACNLASLNLLAFRDSRRRGSSTSKATSTPCGCGPSCSKSRC